MGVFSHKGKKDVPKPDANLYFVVYALPTDKEDRFKEEFDAAFGRSHAVHLNFAKPPAAVRAEYAADGRNDRYLTITPRGSVAGNGDKVIEAVRTATRKAGGSSMCPVRT